MTRESNEIDRAMEDARKWIAVRCDAADQSGARSITINTAVLRLAFPEPEPVCDCEAWKEPGAFDHIDTCPHAALANQPTGDA